MKDNRKTAKRLLLVNWSCFQNEIINLGSSTLFTGVNGTGKTTILDAMSYLITSNTQFILPWNFMILLFQVIM